MKHREGRTINGQLGGMMGVRHDPWFLEMSPYHPAHYGAFPEYLFHHERGFEKDGQVQWQPPQLSLPQGLSLDRVRDRAGLREALESQCEALRFMADDGFDQYREAAISLLTNHQVQDAFSLAKESAQTLDRYGRNSFGWSLIMARRMLEAGVSLVQVNLGNNESWDTHQNAWPNLKNFLLPPMDRAVSALLDDLEATGLLDETLVVMATEFGRTPGALNGVKGRHHYNLCYLSLFAGGGVKGGRILGATDKDGAQMVETGWKYRKMQPKTENLYATIYSAMGIDWRKELTGTPSKPSVMSYQNGSKRAGYSKAIRLSGTVAQT